MKKKVDDDRAFKEDLESREKESADPAAIAVYLNNRVNSDDQK